MKTPELAKCCKKIIEYEGQWTFPEQELAAGGNWASAHRMWCWTRLMDGNRANKIMTEMLTEEGFENVLTFQHAEYRLGSVNDLYKEGKFVLSFSAWMVLLHFRAALLKCLYSHPREK